MAQWVDTATLNAKLNMAHLYGLTRWPLRVVWVTEPTLLLLPVALLPQASKCFLHLLQGGIPLPGGQIGLQVLCQKKRIGEIWIGKWRVSAFSNCNSCYGYRTVVMDTWLKIWSDPGTSLVCGKEQFLKSLDLLYLVAWVAGLSPTKLFCILKCSHFITD